MKKSIAFLFIILFLGHLSFGQELAQTIRGTITDVDSELPLIGAEILIAGSNPVIGTTTDIDGKYRLDNIAIGRIAVHVRYLGYEEKIIPNVIVNSGKEVILNLQLQESTVKLEEIVVTANNNKGEALNDMALISTRSVSPEQTNRYAGGFSDPSRIMSNFAGVTNTQDGSNDIIVRGNAPKYIQWRLEGVQISNPNHFADQSSVGGAVSTLNNNILATSDFHTGAFTAEFGDVLSGVYDVKLRAGNNEQFEAVFGFGLLGTDLTLEGPFKKGYNGSYLVNYRYSTASIVSDLGLIDPGGIPKFQDAAFKVVLPTKKAGTFSIFGLSGLSSFIFEDVKPSIWETPGDNSMLTNIKEDYKKKSYLINTGINHTLSLSRNSYLKTTVALSREGIEDKIFESSFTKIYDENDEFLRDSITQNRLNFNSDLTKTTYRAAITYNNKINAKHKIQAGTKFALFDYEMNQSQFRIQDTAKFTLVDFKENISSVRNFISWKYRINDKMTMILGAHNMNVLYNNKSTLESRFAFNWKLKNNSSLNFGYGQHSNMESIHHYFAKIQQEDGSIIEPNKDLDLLKAHHFVLGYEKRIGKNLRAKVEAYYQHLYDIPVENIDTSYFSTINEGLEFRYVDLVNSGTGKNYGIEFTLERFFNNNYYYMINASLYNSKYKSLEGVVRNTQYNGNYLVNILVGKEFENLGKKKNQTLGLNAKIFYGGGRKIIPLLRDNQGNLAVNPENGQFYDYEKAYNNKIEDTYLIVVSANYKWNKPRATHELILTVDNVTNSKGKINEFYDEDEPNNIGYVKQFGLFPNLMYRVYF